MNDVLTCIICLCMGAMLAMVWLGTTLAASLNEMSDYAKWLGKPCWMHSGRKNGRRWLKYRVVAVSHKGSIAVRRWEDQSGHNAFWVDKTQVPDRVRFDDMTIGCER